MPKKQTFGTSCFVERDDRFYHLDADGQQIGEPYSTVFVHKKLLVAEVECRFGISSIIDTSGKRIGGFFLRDHEDRPYKDGPGKIEWIDAKGKVVAVMPGRGVIGTFDETLREAYKNVRWVQKGKHWLILDADGNTKGPKGVTYVNDFFDDLALVKIGKIWTYVKPDGSLASNRTYKEAWDFFEQRAWVREGKDWFLIDPEGRRVHDDGYDEVGDNDEHAYVAARKGNGWFIVRRKDGLRSPDEAFDKINRSDRGLQTGTEFNVCRGKVWETLHAKTGARHPYDPMLAVRAMFVNPD